MPTKLIRTDSASTFSTFNSASFEDAESHFSETGTVESTGSAGSYIPPVDDQAQNVNQNGGVIAPEDGAELTPQATITETDNVKPEKAEKAEGSLKPVEKSLDVKPLETKPLKSEEISNNASPSKASPVKATPTEPAKAEPVKPTRKTDTTGLANPADKTSPIKSSQPEAKKEPSLVDKQDPSTADDEGYHRQHSECHDFLRSTWCCDAMGCGEWSINSCWTALLSATCGALVSTKGGKR